jgi:WD40 repeat protein
LLALSLAVGSLAFSQRDQTRDALVIADAGRLASRSRVEQDPVLALLMAREAVNLDDSPETRSALFAALERSPAITDRIFAPGGASPAGDETQWIAMSPDGRTLAIGDASPAVELFDAVQQAPLGALDVGTGTDRASFSPDGRTLVIATSSDKLVSVDVATRTERGHVGTKGPVDAIAFAPDGTRLLTAEALQDKELLIPRDPVTLEPSAPSVRTRRGEDQIAPLASFAMAFDPEGRSLVTTRPGQGPTVVWNADLRPVRRLPLGGNEIAVSPNGRVAAIVKNTGEGGSHEETRVAFVNIRTGVTHVTSVAHGAAASTQFETTGVAFTPDGRTVVTAGNDSRLVMWDVGTASIRTSLGGTGNVPLRGPEISPDGTTAFTTDRNRDVVLWDLTGSTSLARPFTAGSGFGQWPYFAVSPNGRMIAVASAPGTQFGVSGTIALIDTSSLRVVRRIAYRSGSPMGLAFSPDSSTLVVGSWNEPRFRSSVRLWDVTSGRPETSDLPGIEGTQVWALAFSPDGDTLAGGGPVRDHGNGSRAFVWDLSEGGRLEGHVHAPQPINQLAYTPDGSLLTAVTGQSEGGNLMMWDAGSLATVLNVPIDNVGVYSSDVSNDGRTIVTGGQAGPRIWDIAMGNPLGPALTGLNGFASTIDMSSDGSTVVGADESGHVVFWDVQTGTTIGDPLPGPGPNDNWLAAYFTPDGRHVSVVSETGSGWVWNVDPSDWETMACRVAGRSLTAQEWQEFLPDRPYHATCSS